jgi:predicted acylesterase/phospholipase RssA
LSVNGRKYILSIDGGGVRGMIALYALQELEKQKGQPARSLFSLMAGTSTGAIIISALALGVAAERLIGLYRELVGQIFHDGLYVQGMEALSQVYGKLATTRLPFHNLWTELSEYSDAAARFPRGYLYPSVNICRCFSQAIAQETGLDPATLLLDHLAPDVLITAQGIQDAHTWYFVKSRPEDYVPGTTQKAHRTTGDLKLVDCVTGSAAAPTYFSPWEIDECVGASGRRIGHVADGGVTTANNPVYQACVEAFGYMDEKYAPAETVVISLGTGRRSEARPIPVPNDLLEWLKWSFDMLLESPARQQLDFVHKHYPETALYRIDKELTEDIDLGDASAIPELEEYGRRLAEQLREPGADWHSIFNGQENQWLYRCQREVRAPGATLAPA